MTELPFMPVKVEALLADTANMTAEEFGAYVRLLLAMWLRGGKLTSTDARELAQIAGVSRHRWLKIARTVTTPMILENGYISQKRLMATRILALSKKNQRRSAALTRWKGKR